MASADASEREPGPQAVPPEPLAPAPDRRADFVARHQRGLWRFARLLGAATDHADDLVQEALLAALHKQVDARPDPEAAAWLRAALRHLWRMHLRTQRRRPAHHALDATPELAEAALARHGGDDGSGEAFAAALRQCLGTLDGRARRALELRYAEQSSRTAMASELAMREDGIKTLLRRTREALFACVQRRLREDER
jgi:RNA polymerase sigma-70 factor, ECF subfamily